MIGTQARCRRDRQAKRRSDAYPELGLTCLNNRHYDPTTGVFISVDPLVTKTMQPYIYGAANPVKYSDPTGLCSQFTMGADGDWTCEFYSGDGGRVAVDNHGETCNIGRTFCSVDEGVVPADYVFSRPDGSFSNETPDEYVGVPTGANQYERVVDPFERLTREIEDHVTVGFGGCLFICGHVEFQDGHLSFSGGEFGFAVQGVTVGLATDRPEDREPAAIGGHAALGPGLGWSTGITSEEIDGLGDLDHEIYGLWGVGISFGPSYSWGIELWDW